jgi:hypothetical protein
MKHQLFTANVLKHWIPSLETFFLILILFAEHKQFGGKIVVLGGDFRQTLPVIQNVTKKKY